VSLHRCLHLHAEQESRSTNKLGLRFLVYMVQAHTLNKKVEQRRKLGLRFLVYMVQAHTLNKKVEQRRKLGIRLRFIVSRVQETNHMRS
jgi:hypothetical protein